VEKLLDGPSGGRVIELPGGAKVRRLRGRLEVEPGTAPQNSGKHWRRGKTN